MTEHADASILRKTRIDHIATEFERVWRLGVERESIEHALATNGDVPKDELLRELLLLEIELRQGDGQCVSQADYRFRFSAHSAVLECVFAELKVPSELTDTLVLWSAESITDEGHSASEDPSGVWRASSHHATLLMDSGARPVVDVRPRVIGDFELIEQIDEGGMGVVYKARQKSLNRIVALKLIKSGVMANADELRRFRREAEAVAKLNHPNILPIYEFGKHGDSTLYIAMPFVQGKTLRDSLGNGTMNPRASAELLLTLAKAMVHAHERQILHRDLKPNNILIDERQNPLILDFGLACDVSLNEQLTQSGQIMGAPGFMPPEQAGQQNGKTDFRSDIYALGAILYYTLRGVAPFTGASGLDVIQRVLNDDPVSPRADDKSIPRDLETICLKCLRKEKAQRYQTAEELASDLALFLEGKPIVARPLPVLEQAIRWCRRRPWQAAIVGLLLLFAFAATATAGVMTKMQKEERHARLQADDARRQAEDARLQAEAAVLDAQDATVYALEHQVRAQLSASDPAAISTGVMADTATQPAAAKSIDNTYVENERAYSLPKVLNTSAGYWGYFDFRPSPSGKLLAVCDHSGVVQILDASNGREIHKLAKATTRPEDNWDMHLAFFEADDPKVEGLLRPVFTFAVDWIDESTLVAVDDQKRLLKYSLDMADATDTNQTAAPLDHDGPASPGDSPAVVVLSELSEAAHLVRVRPADGAVLVCLESGVLNLLAADGSSVATNAETSSRPMNCQYHPELKSWFVGFENGDVVVLDDQLVFEARMSTESPVLCVAISRYQNQWMADVACAHRPLVRYAWNAEARSFTEIATFDVRSRMYDHYFVACVSHPDSDRLFARDTKGNIVAWNIAEEELIAMFLMTQPSNPWLDVMRATLKWPAILDRNTAFLDWTTSGRLRAVDDMGVIMEFATDGPEKPPTWKTFNVKLGADPSLAAVPRSPNHFWALDASGTLSKIDAAEGTILLTVPNAHPGPVPSLVAMSDGRLLTVSGDRTIRVWSTDDGQPRKVRQIEHERNLISLAVHEKTPGMAERIAAMDETAVVSLWETETGRKVMSANMPEIAFLDNNELPLAVRNAEAAARKTLTLSTRPYTGRIAFNKSGQYLAAFGVGQQFDILDCQGNLKAIKVGGSYYDAGAQGGTALCWSGTHDGRLIAGDEFGTAGVWIDGKEPASHTERITRSIAFRGHPVDCRQTVDKGRLCLLMRDGRLMFLTSAHFVPTNLVDSGVRNANSVGVGSTGQTLLVAGRDGTLRSAVFADFSLPEETTLKKLKGTRHQLLSADDNKYLKPGSNSIPAMTSGGRGTTAMIVASNPAGWDGELFLVRRRDDVWRLDPVKLPDSPGTNAPHVFSESAGIVFSKDDRPIVALRQELPVGSYHGRLLLAREQEDRSWETEVVLNSENEGHTCFPIRDAHGEVNSVLHFDYGIMRCRLSRRGPLIEGNWPTETLAKGRGFRLSGFQTSDGTVHVCGRSIRGGGDYAPDRYLIMKPGEPLRWDYAPGQILMSLPDGTPVNINSNTREAACGTIYRRKGNDWDVWTKIPGSFSELRTLSPIFIATEGDLWISDYRPAARRLYAWNFKGGSWSCFEIEVELPDLITMTTCWVESDHGLSIMVAGAAAEPGGIDIINVALPRPPAAP